MSNSIIKKKKSPYYHIKIVYQDPFGNWKSTTRTTGETSKRKAKEKAATIEEKFLLELEQTYSAYKSKIDKSQMTLEEYAKDFLDNATHLTIPTKDNYSRALTTHILPVLGKKRVRDLTGNDIDNFIRFMLEDCKKRQDAIDVKIKEAKAKGIHAKISQSEKPYTFSISKFLTVLHIVLDAAEKIDRITDYNAVDKVNPNLKKGLPKNDMEIIPYSLKEIALLERTVLETKLELPVVLAASLGLRKEEVLGLTYSDIDFEKGIVKINRAIVKVNKVSSALLKKTKTSKSTSTLPLGPALIEYLKICKKKQDQIRKLIGPSFDNHEIDYEDDLHNIRKLNYIDDNLDFICRDEYGEVLKPNFISHAFNSLLEENGLRKTRFHDLRHSVGVRILEVHNDPKMAQEILRHTTITTTMDIYAKHVSDSYKKQGTDCMEEVAENMLENIKNGQKNENSENQ